MYNTIRVRLRIVDGGHATYPTRVGLHPRRSASALVCVRFQHFADAYQPRLKPCQGGVGGAARRVVVGGSRLGGEGRPVGGIERRRIECAGERAVWVSNAW